MEIPDKINDTATNVESYAVLDVQSQTSTVCADIAAPTEPQKRESSGAYYYVPTDERRLALYSLLRSVLTTVAFAIQILVLLLPAQAGALFVSKHIVAYALLYVFVVIFGVLGVSIWLTVMNKRRYKIAKRIPFEYAPKRGFSGRVYFGLELYMVINGVMAVFELSFVFIRFDVPGLIALLLCLCALGAAIAARTITHVALKDAELVSPPDENE